MFPDVGRQEAEQDGEDEVFPGIGRWEAEQDGDEEFPGVALQEGHILKQTNLGDDTAIFILCIIL